MNRVAPAPARVVERGERSPAQGPRGASFPGRLDEEDGPRPHFQFERQLVAAGFARVAGVDEAGRGPLAGPVAAAAVVLDARDLPEGLDDSKALTAPRRDLLYAAILSKAVAVSIGFSSVAEIDRVNIRQATFLAMRRAVCGLSHAPHYVLVDGNDHPPHLPCPGHAIVKGDARVLSIAAASILAKVTRDRLMLRLDAAHPPYAFGVHKGYATALHRAAILRHGLSPHHRRSFANDRVGAPQAERALGAGIGNEA